MDYDELARRLLFQVARRLASGDPPATGREQPEVAGSAVEQRLSALEEELSRARAARLALEEENEELRGQLERIRNNLESTSDSRRPIRKRVPPAAEQIDHRDIALLQKMLVDRAAGGERRAAADSA